MFLLLLFDCSKVQMGEFLQLLHVEELQTGVAPLAGRGTALLRSLLASIHEPLASSHGCSDSLLLPVDEALELDQSSG